MTCQAMMAETWDDVSNWSQAGFIGVDMEAATVFSISNHFGVQSAAMLVISDNLIRKESVLDSSFSQSREVRKLAQECIYKIAIEQLLL